MKTKKPSTAEALNQILAAEAALEEAAASYVASLSSQYSTHGKRLYRNDLRRAALLYGATVRIRLGPGGWR
jgi:hypothetical protein